MTYIWRAVLLDANRNLTNTHGIHVIDTEIDEITWISQVFGCWSHDAPR